MTRNRHFFVQYVIMSYMSTDILLGLFAIFGITGSLLFFSKSMKNVSYILISLAFFCMGLAAFSNNEPSALAAFLLALIASRKIKTKFDRK
jgi:hypothetical protein